MERSCVYTLIKYIVRTNEKHPLQACIGRIIRIHTHIHKKNVKKVPSYRAFSRFANYLSVCVSYPPLTHTQFRIPE